MERERSAARDLRRVNTSAARSDGPNLCLVEPFLSSHDHHGDMRQVRAERWVAVLAFPEALRALLQGFCGGIVLS